MRTRVQKWGNSLALRIPKSFAGEVGLDKGAPVEMTVSDGRLVVRRAGGPAPTLDELLARVTSGNVHREVDTGSAVGKETW